MNPVANSYIMNLHKNTAYSFCVQSSQTDIDNAIHEWIAEIRSIMPVGSNALISGRIINETTYSGFIWKATEEVVFGLIFTPNSSIGYYFRDSSNSAIASSTRFDLST